MFLQLICVAALALLSMATVHPQIEEFVISPWWENPDFAVEIPLSCANLHLFEPTAAFPLRDLPKSTWCSAASKNLEKGQGFGSGSATYCSSLSESPFFTEDDQEIAQILCNTWAVISEEQMAARTEYMVNITKSHKKETDEILEKYNRRCDKDTEPYMFCQSEGDALVAGLDDANKRQQEALDMVPDKVFAEDREFCYALLMQKACLDDGQFYERFQERRDWHLKDFIAQLDVLAHDLLSTGDSEASVKVHQMARELQHQNQVLGTPEEARKNWMVDGRSRDCGVDGIMMVDKVVYVEEVEEL